MTYVNSQLFPASQASTCPLFGLVRLALNKLMKCFFFAADFSNFKLLSVCSGVVVVGRSCKNIAFLHQCCKELKWDYFAVKILINKESFIPVSQSSKLLFFSGKMKVC